jgi:hydroxyacylglutathione hydrolase
MKIDVYTGGYFQTNGYLILHPDGRLVIDAPEGIAEWLADQGIVPDAVLLTHLHYDHVIDAAALRERFGCPIWSHSPPDADLTLETVLKETIGWPFDLAPFSVDRTLAGETEVEIAGFRIRLDHVPGHSPDSLCYRPRPASADQELPVPLLFGGDVLFRGGIGRTDFPHGSHGLLLEGIREKLYTLPDQTRVFPGHGPETTIGREKASNPFVREL